MHLEKELNPRGGGYAAPLASSLYIGFIPTVKRGLMEIAQNARFDIGL